MFIRNIKTLTQEEINNISLMPNMPEIWKVDTHSTVFGIPSSYVPYCDNIPQESVKIHRNALITQPLISVYYLPETKLKKFKKLIEKWNKFLIDKNILSAQIKESPA